jgi:hypothetical protein
MESVFTWGRLPCQIGLRQEPRRFHCVTLRPQVHPVIPRRRESGQLPLRLRSHLPQAAPARNCPHSRRPPKFQSDTWLAHSERSCQPITGPGGTGRSPPPPAQEPPRCPRHGQTVTDRPASPSAGVFKGRANSCPSPFGEGRAEGKRLANYLPRATPPGCIAWLRLVRHYIHLKAIG